MSSPFSVSESGSDTTSPSDPTGAAALPSTVATWVNVLVDCPGAADIYTYQVPPELTVQPGDIVSVPFGAQQLGAIALELQSSPPAHLADTTIRAIETVVSRGLFTPAYWQLLTHIATYYQAPLIQVIRAALPPGLLGKSQQRVRLCRDRLPSGVELFLSPPAQAVLTRLQQSKTGDYTWQYLQRGIRQARRGLQQLQQRGWVETYLEPPTPVRPKRQQAVTVTATPADLARLNLTDRQAEILHRLWRQGGDLWLTDALQLCQTSTATLKKLADQGCVVIQPRERLRTATGADPHRDRPKTLTPAQVHAVHHIQACTTTTTLLLHGVTGSGKTEVYLQAIAPRLAQGQSALILVPEIGLTPQLTDRVQARFGDRVLLYHSNLSDGERYDTWRVLLAGEPRVVIGTRSAVFLPLPHLGLIVLDEEHDPSFKQDQPAPTYHARTVAQWRSQLENCPLVLGSATPALESWVEVQGVRQTAAAIVPTAPLPTEGSPPAPLQKGGERATPLNSAPASLVTGGDRQGDRLAHLSDPLPFSDDPPLSPVPSHLSPNSQLPTPNSTFTAQNAPWLYLTLPDRIESRPHPTIQVVDLRSEFQAGNRSMFSRPLQLALEELKPKGQQGILFIHRRGHSTFVSCRECGYVLPCPDCDVSLSYHQPTPGSEARLRCHYCNHSQAQPATCPECQSPYLKNFGSGTQRVIEALAQQFPELSCIRFDSDTTRAKGAHRALLTRFAQGGADLLVGTQMLTKGIDLPQVTLMGILAADGLLYMSDYRASERTFQTLIQAAGRSGRGVEPGRVILQTYNPDHPVIQAVQAQDYPAFAAAELELRRSQQFPPFCRLALLRLSSPDPQAVEQAAEAIATVLETSLLKTVPECEILGPAPAPIERVARRYRWRILIKIGTETPLPPLQTLRSDLPPGVSLTIDIDPLNLN